MKLSKLLLVCAAAFMSNSTAQADCNSFPLALMFGYGGNANVGLSSYIPAPPYFALHPPVYYGARYTRPYGVSPYAAWPQLQAAPSYMPRPHADHGFSVDNPHFSPVTTAGAGAAEVVTNRSTEPLVIDNPYYQPKTKLAGTSIQ